MADDDRLNDRLIQDEVQERRWPNILKPCIIYLLVAALAVLVYQYLMAIQQLDSLNEELRLSKKGCKTDFAECRKSLEDVKNSLGTEKLDVANCRNELKQKAIGYDECRKSQQEEINRFEEAVTNCSKTANFKLKYETDLAKCQNSLEDLRRDCEMTRKEIIDCSKATTEAEIYKELNENCLQSLKQEQNKSQEITEKCEDLNGNLQGCTQASRVSDEWSSAIFSSFTKIFWLMVLVILPCLCVVGAPVTVRHYRQGQGIGQ